MPAKMRPQLSTKVYKKIYLDEELWNELTIVAGQLDLSRNHIIISALKRDLEARK